MREPRHARRRAAPQQLTTGRETERWRTFLAFWIAAAIVLIALGISVFAAVHNGHRIGFALFVLGLVSLAIAQVVHGAARRGR